jgi:methyl-accepting chemotaxis protein
VIEINNIVSGIAGGAKDQATGLDEVNIAINEMDQVTQQNAAMVEETTAASQSLSQETTQLSGLIGQFQVGRTGADNSMRRQLEKAAPHAFRPAPKPVAAKGSRPVVRVAASNARPEARKEAAGPARAASKAVANGADGNSWEEF